jgi:Carboxypeptidase regulatory-like domain
VKRALLSGIFPLLFVMAGTAAAQDPVVAEPSKPRPTDAGKPIEISMPRAGSTTIDLRKLPQAPPIKRERPEREPPDITRVELPGGPPAVSAPSVPGRNAPAPPTIANFDGLDFATWGAGHPPDTNGDVGPTYFIETVNTSIGIYQKTGGAPVAAFTFNTFMSQGSFGNLCDTNNFGDPVVLYDSFENRWVITDFAFTLDGSGNVINPPGSFQCFAVSKTGDPVLGGWNFYSINTTGGLGDYPKFGIWPDGLYMSANMFDYAAAGAFQGPRVYALNKAQMYAGSLTVQVVTFNAPSADFTLLPSNARLQTGTPPPGTPNYYLSTWEFTNALTVYKFHVDWTSISLSTFTGPDTPLAATSWPNATVPNAPSLGGNAGGLDVLQIRAMMQNQYSNLGGAESLWTTHTVRRGNTTGFAAPRWYQVDVTGRTVAANLPQAATWDPDAANVIYRFMPSLAIDRAGNMALGYSTSSSTTKPAIKYAGRLSSDPVNTLGQTEQLLIQGTGTQLGNCGGAPCLRWGDYSAMSLDPDGCTLWYTNMYYAVDGLNDLTRIGSFAFPSCTPVGPGGTLSGTVTATVGGAPISGATISFGSRTTTTAGSGFYQFLSVPSGTYPSITASAPGYNSSTATSIVVTDGATTTQDFSLGTAPVSACLTDTTQADFQTGVPTNVDLTTSPGDVLLAKPSLDQLNETLSNSGVGITITTWGGETFTPAVTGLLTKADINLFCSGCTGTTPNLTLSVRATSGGLPTGADLASATITGFSNGGAASYFTVTFGSPPTLTAGTMYALVIRPVANPAPGIYALTRSSTNVYAGGTRVSGATSGTVWSIPLTAGQTTDAGFRTYMDSGFAPSGNLVSSSKDSNPPVGFTPTWTTLSWTASTPANTTLGFQVAGSNSISGPFSFVGPDGTAGTFFTTSGASLSPQFDGNRYLKYKAYLSTTNSAVSPTVNDVTLCYTNGCTSPATPTIAPGGPTTFCAGGSVTLTSSSATGNQWYRNGSPIGGVTGQPYIATASGNYTVVVTASGCSSAPSAATTVTVNPIPATPTIAPGGPTTFCAGGSVTLTSSSATGNQWYRNGSPIGGATALQYVANASGSYTVVVTASGCSSAPSAATTVTVSPIPTTPTITAGGPTTFCAGGSVTLTSSSATGNQWYLNGSPIGGATTQQYNATASGSYTVVVTSLGCASAPSAATTVTVNLIPAPVITAPTTVGAGSPNRTAGVPAHAGSTYAWVITNGTITAGQGTSQITFTAGTAGTPLTLSVTETTAPGCVSALGTATVTVLPAGSAVLFYTVTCRQLDTRSGSPISPGGTLAVALTGAPCGIPSGATSVSVNTAVTQETGSGHLTIYPADKTQPLVSNINFNAGQTRANNAVLGLSSDGTGRVNVANGSGGTVHIVIDVNGYFQ